MALTFTFIRRLFGLLWRALDFTRRLVSNLLLLLVLFVLLAALLLTRDEERVPESGVLTLNVRGRIVEQLSYVPPAMLLFRQGIDEPEEEETLLKDVLDAIALARDDARIKVLVLQLERLKPTGLSKLQEIGRALTDFRQSGKPVIARGNHYTQSQYYLAAHADEVYLHPMGGVLLQGYGIYPTYLKSALEKFLVQVHAFRVGAYKSALEPFLRDDMSPEAKKANLAWLDLLWDQYRQQVAAQRRLPPEAIDRYIEDVLENLDQVGGDSGQLALTQGLVDGLKTREAVRERLNALTGQDDDDASQIAFHRYLRLQRPRLKPAARGASQIGVIVAQGTILDGRQRPGQIGGDSLAELFGKARRDERIRAVVLRIDSGGGSAFASEVIRQQVTLTRQAGKPVIASMGSVAASGGYWIAAAADQIWAAPTTLTGSIGIFGAFLTFERSLDALGVHADGVGTSPLAGAFDSRRPLAPLAAGIMERLVDRGYRRFLEVVAEGRGLTVEEVDEMAQGRIWTGAAAWELGLVDDLGDLQAAIQAAARLADLETYEVAYVKAEPTSAERLARLLSGWLGSGLGRIEHPVLQWFEGVGREAAIFFPMNDPQGIYAWCILCATK